VGWYKGINNIELIEGKMPENLYTDEEKIKDVITISDKNHHKKNWKFNELLDTLD
jgi:hypothetical protein